MELKTLDKKIKAITYRNYAGIGIFVLDESENILEFFDQCGEYQRFTPATISLTTIKNTRSISSETREELIALWKEAKKKYNLQAKKKKLEEEIREQNLTIARRQASITKVAGLLSKCDFEKAVENELTRLMDDISLRKYNEPNNVGAYYAGAFCLELEHDNTIRITRRVTVDKYINEDMYSFVYQEYDGCLFLIPDTEKDKTYQKILAKYKTSLNFKGCKYYSWLDTGDKNTLNFHEEYSTKLDKNKPYTKEFAKEIAKKIVNG